MSTRVARSFVATLAAAVAATGCMATTPSPRLAEIERLRTGAAAQEGAKLAAPIYARAEEERGFAAQAAREGDRLGAELHADRAIAAYEHAFVLARAAHAVRELADAKAESSASEEEMRSLVTSRAQVESEAADLDARLRVGREALVPAPSGPADPTREAARLTAARAMALDARLLCGAARLVLAGSRDVRVDAATRADGAKLETSAKADPKGEASRVDGGDDAHEAEALLAEAEKGLAAVETSLEGKPKTAPIDGAARARARCLDALTHTRRTAKAGVPAPDALLAELSASGGLDPYRNERGVVVTLRDPYKGDVLTAASEGKLQELGRVAAAHPGVSLQAVAHDATGVPDAREKARGDVTLKALTAGGAPPSSLTYTAAGVRAPLVDPTDAAHRARNARLEIVFVTAAN